MRTGAHYDLRWAIYALLGASLAVLPCPGAEKAPKQAAPKKSETKSAKEPVRVATPHAAAIQYAGSGEPQPIDLVTVLRLAGVQNLDVQIAGQKYAEAHAGHEQARQQFFPWISPGLSHRRHDGQIQAVEGRVFDASKQSYTAGGTIGAQLDLGEAWFKALAAKQSAEAAGHAVEAERQQAAYRAVLAYFDLAQAQAQAAVAQESVRVSADYERQLEAAAQTGIAFKGDVYRVNAQTERFRLTVSRAQQDQRLAGARLAQTLRLDPTIALLAQAELAPVELVSSSTPLDRLVAQALNARPELAQQGALLKAAKREAEGAKYGPLVPNLSAQYFAGGLGGGFNGDIGNFDGTSSYQMLLGWRVGPGGLLDRPRREAAEARVGAAGLLEQKLRDAVVTQVVEAQTRVNSLADQLATARRALAAADEMVKLSRQRKEFGVGVVLETLLAEQELTSFRNDYLLTIARYNQAQYALAAATGQLGRIP